HVRDLAELFQALVVLPMKTGERIAGVAQQLIEPLHKREDARELLGAERVLVGTLPGRLVDHLVERRLLALHALHRRSEARGLPCQARADDGEANAPDRCHHRATDPDLREGLRTDLTPGRPAARPFSNTLIGLMV